MIKVGHFTCTRQWQKFAFNNPPKNIKYVRAFDIPFPTLGINNQFLQHTKYHFASHLRNINFLHTYNSIVPYGPNWIIEVEYLLPRYGKNKNKRQIDFAIKRLQSKSCKCISFTSEMAFNLNTNFLKENGLESKTMINYRPVKITNESYFPRIITNTFNIVFVGNAFYRKGGVELLRAFINNPNRTDWRLNIISTFETDWVIYPSTEQKLWVQKSIANDKRISVFSNISHDDVYKTLKTSHLFIATTYADTWNNSILEALVNGIPVIASNISPIPEMIQSNINGVLIDVNTSSIKITNEIEIAINNYYNNPSLLYTHSKNAYKLSHEKFSLTTRNNKLAQIFNK